MWPGKSTASSPPHRPLDKHESVSDRIDFLSRFGTFNEVTAGGRFANSGGLRYTYRGFPAAASTPQLLFVVRTTELTLPPALASERVVLRLGGWITSSNGYGMMGRSMTISRRLPRRLGEKPPSQFPRRLGPF